MANAAEADFYGLEQLLDDHGRDALQRTREFMTKEIEPVINHYWTREEFPHDLIPAFAGLGIAGTAYDGYGCPGGGPLLDGMIAMELARTDPSISTFMGVHSGLAMGSIYLCGSEEQKQRWLPEMARMEKIGAFGLTEPDVGSGVAGGLTTTARRDGEEWVLDGQKKWIGNATFADYVIIWARSLEDGEVKGFVVEKGTPGFETSKMQDKIALRVVQNAHITMDGVRVPEENRLCQAMPMRGAILFMFGFITWMLLPLTPANSITPLGRMPVTFAASGFTVLVLNPTTMELFFSCKPYSRSQRIPTFTVSDLVMRMSSWK